MNCVHTILCTKAQLDSHEQIELKRLLSRLLNNIHRPAIPIQCTISRSIQRRLPIVLLHKGPSVGYQLIFGTLRRVPCDVIQNIHDFGSKSARRCIRSRRILKRSLRLPYVCTNVHYPSLCTVQHSMHVESAKHFTCAYSVRYTAVSLRHTLAG